MRHGMQDEAGSASADVAVRHGVVDAAPAKLAYEDCGDPNAPPLVLIMGLGAQMVMWPDAFCERLAKAGLRVIRFDNRDVGLSGRMRTNTTPPLWRLILRAQLGLSTPVPYSLLDMADDTVALMDALNVSRAHIVGASMGGMIAQLLAARHPARTASLTVLFSSTNQPLLPPTSPPLLWKMLGAPRQDASLPRQKAHLKRLLRALGTSRYPVPDKDLDDIVERMAGRGLDRAGVRRQLAAVLGTGDLRPYARKVRAPTVVIHGEQDRMLPKAAGIAVARAIPGAILRLIPGMGHDLPPQLWPVLVDLIVEHARAAQGRAARQDGGAPGQQGRDRVPPRQ